jgi:hypothetical protein
MTAFRQTFSRTTPSDEALEALLAAADEVADEIERDTTTEESEAA